MFRLQDSKPHINALWIGTAKCKDQATVDTLQKGGFITLEAAKKGKQPIAIVADPDSDASGNFLNSRLIYPIFISRLEDTAAKHKPIEDNWLIDYFDDTNYTGYLNADSYYQDGSTYPTIVAGMPMKLVNNSATSNRPKLVGQTDIDKFTVALALSGVDSDLEVKIKWIG